MAVQQGPLGELAWEASRLGNCYYDYLLPTPAAAAALTKRFGVATKPANTLTCLAQRFLNFSVQIVSSRVTSNM